MRGTPPVARLTHLIPYHKHYMNFIYRVGGQECGVEGRPERRRTSNAAKP